MVKAKSSNRPGQILLMLILISSVLLTVGLSMTQIGVNETKISKMEEESKKAFQAADAGIEKTLDSLKNDPNITGIEIPSSDLNQVGVKTQILTSTQVNPRQFKTPVIKKDEQFTFYLANYDQTAETWSNSYNGNLTFYLNSNDKTNCASGSRDVPAIELTYIYSNPYTTEKYIIDSCNTFTTPDNRVLNTQDYNGAANSYFVNFNKVTNEPLSIDSSKNPRIVIARVLYGDTMVGFEGSADLKGQGKYITSTANSSTNVTKKVELFQSLPQIPADFFVTSF